jgi:hypothetical protein
MLKKGFFLLLFFCPLLLTAQTQVEGISLGEKPFKPYLTVGGGPSWSVINNRREVRGLYKPGLNVNTRVFTSRWFALSADYTWFFPHASSPAFTEIKSWNTEVNANLYMNIGQTRLLFKILFGLQYMEWEGTYVGPTLNDNNKYRYGMRVGQDWLAANMGYGMMYPINSRLVMDFDFRMRFTSEKKDLIGISDTGFFLSGSYRFGHVDSEGHNSNSNAHRKTTKGRAGRQYKWLKKRN